MFGTPFYNEGLRKIIIAFGQLFNNIVIENVNRTTGAVTKRIKVPLAYAPKEKFLVRLEQQPDLTDRSFAITLPRIGFEISGLQYDPSRKLTRVHKFRKTKVDLSRSQSAALLDRVQMEDESGLVILEKANAATGHAEYILHETDSSGLTSSGATFNCSTITSFTSSNSAILSPLFFYFSILSKF